MSNTSGQEGTFQPPFEAPQELLSPASRFDGLRERLEAYAVVGFASGVLLVEAAAMAWGSKPDPTPEEIAASDRSLRKLSASEIKRGGHGQGRPPTDDEIRGTARALGISEDEARRQSR